MKYNITTLKKEVPKHIRLEVYKEALNREDWLSNQGLCVGLPKIMLGVDEQKLGFILDTATGRGMYYRDTSIAFPELTDEVIKLLENNVEPEPLRLEYLREWIRVLGEDAIEQTLNTEK